MCLEPQLLAPLVVQGGSFRAFAILFNEGQIADNPSDTPDRYILTIASTWQPSSRSRE